MSASTRDDIPQEVQTVSHLTESLENGVAVVSSDLLVLAWNRPLEAFTRTQAADIVGLHLEKACPLLFNDTQLALTKRALAGEVCESDEFGIPVVPGALVHWCSCRYAPWKNRQGKIIGVLIEVRDRTEEHTRASAQRLADRNYKNLFDSAIGGMYQTSADGRFLNANQALARMLGDDSVEALLGRVQNISRDLYLNPNDRRELLRLLDLYEVVRNYEFKARRADGRVIWLAVTVRKVKDQEGRFLFYEGIASDVTVRKEAEAEVQRLAAFPRFNPHPILEFDREGSLTYFNFAARSLAEKLGCSALTQMLPRDIHSVVGSCLEKESHRLDYQCTVAGRTLSWSFFPIVPHQVVHVYGFDLTERLQLEATLRQAQKMESIGKLAAGVAHDFNNLLTVIQGNADLLEVSQLISPTDRLSLKEIANAAERASNLTRQLLTFSRRQPVQKKTLNLDALISDLAKMLRRLLGEDVVLQLQFQGEPVMIFADPGMIEQIVINLSVNARDAMAGGGTLSIGTSILSLNEKSARANPERRTGTFVVLEATDSGCGIDESIRPHLFEPFFTTKETGKGTGLGLATVYGAVKQHDGWIELDSTPDQGTTFRIFFPADTRTLPEEELNQEGRALPGGSETILVVEDEKHVRQLAVRVLHRLGYRVIEAASGLKAQKLLEEQTEPIDLILTDLVMPEGVSGLELARHVREKNPKARIVFSTGYSLELEGNEFSSDPHCRFLSKPWPFWKLAATLRELLDRKPV